MICSESGRLGGGGSAGGGGGSTVPAGGKIEALEQVHSTNWQKMVLMELNVGRSKPVRPKN